MLEHLCIFARIGVYLALGGKGKPMVYYAPSVFYPVVGKAHGKVLQFAARQVRQPVFLVNGVVGDLPGYQLPPELEVALLNDREHVLTISTSSTSVQFSQNFRDLAASCAAYGWLEVEV